MAVDMKQSEETPPELDAQTLAKIDELLPAHPHRKAFGDHFPSRLVAAHAHKYPAKDAASVERGSNINRGLSAHWGSAKIRKLAYQGVKSRDQISFERKGDLGEYFSLSFQMPDEIFESANQERMVSAGFASIKFDDEIAPKETIYARLQLVLGKRDYSETKELKIFDDIWRASFDIANEPLFWEKAQRGWFDLIFPGSGYKTLTLSAPLMWVQEKVVL